MKWGSLGIAIACGFLVWSYQKPYTDESISHWVALVVIGGATALFAMSRRGSDSSPKE